MMGAASHIKQLWARAPLRGKLALLILFSWVVIGVFAPWIAQSGSIVPFAYDDLQGLGASFLSPTSSSNAGMHWLGTDSVGRDVAAGMIHGARVSLVLCVLVITMSLIAGLLIGVMMGYFGDRDLKFNLGQLAWLVICVYLISYYKMDAVLRSFSLWSLIATVLVSIFLFAGLWLLDKLSFKKYSFPLDSIWQRIIEVKESLPNIFLLLAIAVVVTRPSVWTLAFTMILLYWVSIARHARIEMLKVKEEDYFIAAKAQGLPLWLTLYRHAIPNIMGPILVVVAFALSGIILMESSLSFLGIGLPLEEVTWGKLLITH